VYHIRYDYNIIKEKHIDKSTGFLKIPAHATRTGIFTYVKADGSVIKEYRAPEEVFNADSMNSLRSKPVTLEHPDGLVNLDNAKNVMVGLTSDTITKEADLIRTDVTITDKKTIRAIEKGKQELSCGYTCDVEYTEGEINGEKYDAIQKNIQYNHVAIVDKGRAGYSARLRLDSNEARMVQDSLNGVSYSELDKLIKRSIQVDDYVYEIFEDYFIFENNANELFKQKYIINDKKITLLDLPVMVEKKITYIKKEDSMDLSINGVKIDVSKEVFDAFETLKQEKSGLQEKLATLEKSVSKLEAKKDALETELKEKAEQKLDEEQLNKLVKERLDVYNIFSKVCDKETVAKFDSMSNEELRKAVVLAKHSDLKLDEKDNVYIEARFDIIKENLVKEDKSQSLGRNIANNDGQQNIDIVEQARLDALKRDKEAYKQPLSCSINK
jgi:hypothetical protein